jgi:hypothetical protein
MEQTPQNPQQALELVIAKEAEEFLTEEAINAIRTEAIQIPMAVAALGVIKSPEDFDRAGSAALAAAKIIKQLEELRKAAVKPWNDKVDNINGQFKYFINFFSGFKDLIADRVKVYHAEQKAIAAKAQEILDKAREKELMKAAKKGVLPPPPPPRVETPAKTTHVGGGRVTNVSRPKYRILDEASVPREFLCLDEKKIGRFVRNRDLTAKNAGTWIEIWEEEEPTFA